MKLYISMYHYTRDLIHSRYPNIRGMDVKQLRDQFDFFKKNFNVVRMEDVILAKREGDLPEKALLLTFDDGYLDNYTYALPLLEEYGFQGSFFIPGKTFATHQLLDVNKIHYILASASDVNALVRDLKQKMDYYRGNEFDYSETEELWNQYAIANRFDDAGTIFVKRMLQTALPERLRNTISSDLFESYVGVSEEQLAYELYMTEEQVRTLKRHGMFIGLHGYDHYWLGNLANQDEMLMKEDIEKALETLDEFIDRDAWAMNYPYGNQNDKVLDYITQKGAVLGLTTEVRVADLVKDNKLTLPRLDCNDFPPKSREYLEIR